MAIWQPGTWWDYDKIIGPGFLFPKVSRCPEKLSPSAGPSAVPGCRLTTGLPGGMAERTKAAVLKTAIRASGSWVRIPLPPPFVALFWFTVPSI